MFLYQVIVWIDEKKALILRFTRSIERQQTIASQGEVGSEDGRAAGANDYFERVARAIDIADEILIVGPAVTKDEFLKFMHKNDHSVDPRIVGVETIDEPTESKLSEYTQLYFAKPSSHGSTPKGRNGGRGNGDHP